MLSVKAREAAETIFQAFGMTTDHQTQFTEDSDLFIPSQNADYNKT